MLLQFLLAARCLTALLCLASLQARDRHSASVAALGSQHFVQSLLAAWLTYLQRHFGVSGPCQQGQVDMVQSSMEALPPQIVVLQCAEADPHNLVAKTRPGQNVSARDRDAHRRTAQATDGRCSLSHQTSKGGDDRER